MMHKLAPWMMAVAFVAAAGCKDKDKAKDGTGEKGKGGGDGKGGGAGDGKGGGGGGGGMIKAVSLAMGGHHACAILEDKSVRCWGRADMGELGAGKAETQSASAVAVPGVSGVTQLAIGGDHGDAGDITCGLAGGKTWCWGISGRAEGMPEDGKPAEFAAFAGATHLGFGSLGFAVMGDGTVKGWGGNTFNTLGLGKDKDPARDKVETVPVTDVVAVAGSQNRNCAVHKDGTVSCWGYGIDEGIVKIEGMTDVVQLSGGNSGDEMCAVTKAKTVVCSSSGVNKASPVAGLDNVAQVVAYGHKCARKEDGTVWCWGSNDVGQLGTGAPGDSQSKPVQVQGVTGATFIAAGRRATCAIDGAGAVWCWGANPFGQLGDGSLTDRAAPVKVIGVNDKTPPASDDGTDQTQQHDVAQTFDGLPPGCARDAELDAKLRGFEGKFPQVSAYGKNTDGKGMTYGVTLSNFQVDPEKTWLSPRGKQLSVSFRFAKVDLQSEKKVPQPIDVGVYSMDHKQERLVYVSMADRMSGNIMLGDISLDGVKAGEVEITHVGDGWLCGEARVQTKSSKLAGKFAAKLP